MGAFGKEYHLWMFDELVSSVLSSLKSSSIMVCLKKILNGEMSFKKDTEKIVLLKVKGLIHIVKFRTKKIAYFYHPPPVILSGSTKYCHWIGCQVFCSNKGMNGKFIFPWRKINWHVFQIAKGHFSYSIWLMISEKSIMLCYDIHVSSSWWCMHVPRVSANKAYKKIVYKNFQLF